jgi:hypothetical protein
MRDAADGRVALDTNSVLHEIRVMRNVTVTLDERTARWARVEAARRDISMSSFLREMLERAQAAHESYPGAMRRYQARPPARLKRQGRYPSREELHDRDDLR